MRCELLKFSVVEGGQDRTHSQKVNGEVNGLMTSVRLAAYGRLRKRMNAPNPTPNAISALELGSGTT